MKNKNQRELEKYWAKEAARKARPAKKKARREPVSQSAAKAAKPSL